MNKFMVGDTVCKSIYYLNKHSMVLQRFGTIINKNHEYEVRWYNGESYVYNEIELSFVITDNFRIGDVVFHKLSNDKGTVTDISSKTPTVKVSWDSGAKYWHGKNIYKPEDNQQVDQKLKCTQSQKIDDLESQPKGCTKMEKPKTNMEKIACKEAVEDAIKEAVKEKKKEYKKTMEAFIAIETEARENRILADKACKVLGITDKEMKELFE